jgi:hypothetical protein
VTSEEGGLASSACNMGHRVPVDLAPRRLGQNQALHSRAPHCDAAGDETLRLHDQETVIQISSRGPWALNFVKTGDKAQVTQ